MRRCISCRLTGFKDDGIIESLVHCLGVDAIQQDYCISAETRDNILTQNLKSDMKLHIYELVFIFLQT